MDASEAKLWAVVVIIGIVVLGGIIGAAIYSEHAEQLACIEAGNQVVSGNCLSKSTP